MSFPNSSSSPRFRVAIVGLGFGAEFIPIYQRHPGAEMYAICQRNEAHLHEVGDRFEIGTRYTSYDDVLADPKVDFVHINSPIPDHAWMSLKALEAGKHVMCTVPMATTIEECDQICEAVARTGKKYMMAETVVYSREFLFIKDLYLKGELGEIQHLAASHPQDMDGWPAYWEKMIPMHYATHVVSPCLGLLDKRAEYVSCFGSGKVRDDIREKSGNRFAVETCHIKVQDSDVVAHIWRFLYDVARQYRESFDVYGTKKSFEWTLVEDEPHVIHTAKNLNPRFLPRSKFPILPIYFLNPFVCLRKRFRMLSIFPSFREAGTEVLTRTWCTNSSRLWHRIATPGLMPHSLPTGHVWDCVPISQHSRVVKLSNSQPSL